MERIHISHCPIPYQAQLWVEEILLIADPKFASHISNAQSAGQNSVSECRGMQVFHRDQEVGLANTHSGSTEP